MIFTLLGQNDLALCAQVNKLINAVCTSLLWATIDIMTVQHLQRFMTPETQGAWLDTAVMCEICDYHILISSAFSLRHCCHAFSALRFHAPIF